jgi:predicted esterase
MAYIPSSDIFEQARRFHKEQRYEEALELLEIHYGKYPDQIGRAYFFRMCFQNLLGRQKEALQLFREALDTGHWFSEEMLRRSDDLKSLQGLPEFEKLVEISQGYCVEVRSRTRPTIVIQQPTANQGQERRCLMALHGNGSNSQTAARNWQAALTMGMLLALPQSSQVTNSDGYVWDDVDVAIHEIEDHYITLRSRYSLNRQNTILGGFSMGGQIALRMALMGAIAIRGLILVAAPFMAEAEYWRSLLPVVGVRTLRTYIIVGRDDDVCYEGARLAYEIMQDQRMICEIEEHDQVGHQFPLDFDQSLSRAFAMLFEE